MRLIALAALTAGALAAAPAAHAPQTPPPSRTMAVTIDDLPWVHRGSSPYLDAARKGTTAILEALRTRKAPAIGFVTESGLEAANTRPSARRESPCSVSGWTPATSSATTPTRTATPAP